MSRIAPRRLRLEASSFCQLRCPSCPTTDRSIHPAVGSGFLKFADFRVLVDLNPALERIEISNYGEIFLNPELQQILEYAHRKGVALAVENGANLNNVRDEVLEALVKYQVAILTCSIDGASPEGYRTYRVRGNFARVMRNIETINGFKAAYRSELPHLIWQFVVFGHNEHELPLAREMAARLGMEFRTKLTWDAALSPIRDKDFVQAQTGQPTSRDEFEAAHGEKYAGGICHQLWDDPQINWDGKVLGCCRNFWGDFGGNAFGEGLIASVNSERMVYARDMLSGRKPPRDDIPCTTCEMYQAMRARGGFISRDEGLMTYGFDRERDEIVRDRIDALTAAIDTELKRPAVDPDGFRARDDAVIRLMIAADFPAAAEAGLAPPLVSIVLPTRNRAACIAEAIDSVRAQSFADWELVIVDDGSSDNTAEIVAGYLADPRICYLSQSFAGHAAARNRALGHARGALVAYIDSDNLWYPNFLNVAVATLASSPELGTVYGALVTEAHREARGTILFEDFDRQRLLCGNFIDLNTVVHRRSLTDRHGGFDEALDRLVDWDLLLRITQDGPARRVPVLAARYRIVDDQRVTSMYPYEANRIAIQRKWFG